MNTNNFDDKVSKILNSNETDDIRKSLKTTSVFVWLFVCVSSIAAATMLVKYFAGGTLNPMLWDGEQWIYAFLGAGFSFLISYAEYRMHATLYAGIGLWCILAFGLFAEVSQTMERGDGIVRYRSEESKVFKETVGSIGKIASTGQVNPYASQIIEAETKLAQCEERLARGKEKHCEGAKGRVDALHKLSAASATQNTALLTSAVSQAKQLEYDEDKHYAFTRLLKSVFGLTGIVAMLITALLIIVPFQIAFRFISQEKSAKERALYIRSGRDPSTGTKFDPVSILPVDKPANVATVDSISLPVDKKAGVDAKKKPDIDRDSQLRAAMNVVWDAAFKGELTSAAYYHKSPMYNLLEGFGSSQDRQNIGRDIRPLLAEKGVFILDEDHAGGGDAKYKIADPVPERTAYDIDEKHLLSQRFKMVYQGFKSRVVNKELAPDHNGAATHIKEVVDDIEGQSLEDWVASLLDRLRKDGISVNT
jgi:hypothetical protein